MIVAGSSARFCVKRCSLNINRYICSDPALSMNDGSDLGLCVIPGLARLDEGALRASITNGATIAKTHWNSHRGTDRGLRRDEMTFTPVGTLRCLWIRFCKKRGEFDAAAQITLRICGGRT
jgi:hypothetical protein